MISNYELKTKCKEKLNSIRSMLSPEERQNIEPHLRDILEITKGLMNNAKVSPEDHQALVSQVASLTKERNKREEENQALRQEVGAASKFKDQLSSMTSRTQLLERDSVMLEAMNVDMLCNSLHLLAVHASKLIERCGDVLLSKWVKDVSSTIDNDTECRAMFLICLFWASFTIDDDKVSEIVDDLSLVEAPEKNGLWLEGVREVFAMCGAFEW